MRVPIADAAHAEGELLLDLDMGFALNRVVKPQSGSPHLASAGLPFDLIADVVAFAYSGGAACGCPVGNGVEDERRLEPAAAVFVFVKSQMGEPIPEVQRRPEPEHLESHGLAQNWDLFADRPDAPGAVAGARHLGGVDAQLVAV